MFIICDQMTTLKLLISSLSTVTTELYLSCISWISKNLIWASGWFSLTHSRSGGRFIPFCIVWLALHEPFLSKFTTLMIHPAHFELRINLNDEVNIYSVTVENLILLTEYAWWHFELNWFGEAWRAHDLV